MPTAARLSLLDDAGRRAGARVTGGGFDICISLAIIVVVR